MPLKKWKKGESGNPGGKPKWANRKDFGEVLRLTAPEALDVLRNCLTSYDESVRIQAAKWILEQAFGKAAQPQELSGPEGEAIPIRVTVSIKEPDGGKGSKLPSMAQTIPSSHESR